MTAGGPSHAERVAWLRLARTPGIGPVGFARLIDHFDAYAPPGLVTAAGARGLEALYQELRAFEAADPDCTTAPRVKREDDASAVLIHIDL